MSPACRAHIEPEAHFNVGVGPTTRANLYRWRGEGAPCGVFVPTSRPTPLGSWVSVTLQFPSMPPLEAYAIVELRASEGLFLALADPTELRRFEGFRKPLVADDVADPAGP